MSDSTASQPPAVTATSHIRGFSMAPANVFDVDMMAAAFQTFLLERYPAITAQNVQLGRRKARLQVVDEFFRLDPPSRQLYTTAATPSPEALAAAPCSTDVDPIDALLSDAPGIVVRTNFSDDTTWAAFLSALADGEKELLADAADPPPADDAADGSGSDSDSSEEESTVPSTSGSAEDSTRKDSRQLMFFSIIDPVSVDDRAQLTDACNLAVLRLVADAGVRPAPPVPQGSKRIKPGHRLVDFDGYQEVYTGRGLWIYDAQSNTDGALRMVNLEGDVYGTATGDSWRMRASHITEMQVNMTFHGLKVNFGGMDRWDYPERVRNMEFANLQT